MSIFYKVTLLFLLSFGIMVFIGNKVDEFNTQKNEIILKDRFFYNIKEILKIVSKFDESNWVKRFKDLKLEKVDDKLDLKNYKEIFTREHSFGGFKLLKKPNGDYLYYIRDLDNEMFFIDLTQKDIQQNYNLTMLVFLDLMVLVTLFIIVIKILSPIKNIQRTISDFAKGDYSSRSNIKSKDEIGELSNAFDQMAEKIQKMITSREAFLRDIGHEIKTPLAKGKFAISKLEDSDNKKILENVNKDIEKLINTLIEIERFNSFDFILNKQIIDVETLVITALSQISDQFEDDIIVNIDSNFYIEADLYYMSMVIKNLVDNALKYTTSLPIRVEVENRKISIFSRGEKLSKPLEFYTQPFTQESPNRNIKGFGLGLNIVIKILKAHELNLHYLNKNEFNIFYIQLISIK